MPPTSSSGASSPSIQQCDAAIGNDMVSPQRKRPVSPAESASELLASKSEMGRSFTVSVRRPARKLPARAHTIAAAPISLRVELVDRQSEESGQVKSAQRRCDARSAPSSPAYPAIQSSEYDSIELDDLALPPLATDSTDDLVPSPHQLQSDLVSSHLGDHGPPIDTTTKKAPLASQLRPNYKPISLRWPFLGFLLALIAGFISFLEHHVHDLPPLHYSVIKLSAAQLKKAIPTPEPEPDPRPPESSYPVPDYYEDMFTTYCGWNPPKWKIEQWEVPCGDFSCDKWPVLCSDTASNKTQLRCSIFDLSEAMGTFLTDDPSWCPCGVMQSDDWYTIELEDLEYYWWDTIDRGCKSAMLAVQSMNHFKSARLYETVLLAQASDGTLAPAPSIATLVAEQFYTTPPLPARGYWAYPSTGENGDVLMPFVVRTAGPEIKDVYGNMVGPADIATFPEGFSSIWLDRVTFNLCWNSRYWNNLASGPAMGCTATPPAVLSTVWWTLPTGHAKSATRSSTIDAPTTTSDILQPGNPTSTAEVRSTSTPLIPTSTTHGPATSTQTTGDGSGIVTGSPSSTKRGSVPPSSSTKRDSATPLSSTQRDPNTQSTDDDTEFSTSADQTTPETSTSPSPGPTGLPLIISSGRPDTLLETSSDTTTSTSAAVFPIVGLLPGLDSASSNSVNPPSTSPQASSISIRKAPQQLPAQVVTNMVTEFDSDSVPTRTFTTIETIMSLSNSTSTPAQDMIPPPPFVIPTGSGWIPRIEKPDRPVGGPGSGPVSPEDQTRFFNLRTEADYLMASVFPVLLATLLLIPIQVFTGSVNCILPFRALGRGASAADSLLLARTNSLFISQPRVSFRFLHRFRDPLPFMNALLGTFALLLLPLSSEVIRLEFTENCANLHRTTWRDDPTLTIPTTLLFDRVCATGLRKSGIMIRIAEGLLAVMACLVIVMGCLLSRWRSGVAAEPWSIASMASLLSGSSHRSRPESRIEEQRDDPDLASLLRSVPETGDMDIQLKKTLQDKLFKLGFFRGDADTGVENTYGIEIATPPLPQDKNPIRPTVRNPPERKAIPPPTSHWHRFCQKTSTTLSSNLTIRLTALVLTTGLLILILYYETVFLDSKFEQFMNSQSFGVRILFTAFGTAISGFWDYHFLETSESQIHQHLARGPQLAQKSILLSPPSNIFAGLFQSVLHIRGVLSFNIALATFLAKFTPILLSNVPFHNTVTWKMHESCTWMAVLVLGYMILVLVASTVLSWIGKRRSKNKNSVMPVRVNTIAGAMYYLCESGMVKDFEGLSTRGPKERREVVCAMEKRYVFGEMVGVVSGTRRVGVDYFGEEGRRGGRVDVERQG